MHLALLHTSLPPYTALAANAKARIPTNGWYYLISFALDACKEFVPIRPPKCTYQYIQEVEIRYGHSVDIVYEYKLIVSVSYM